MMVADDGNAGDDVLGGSAPHDEAELTDEQRERIKRNKTEACRRRSGRTQMEDITVEQMHACERNRSAAMARKRAINEKEVKKGCAGSSTTRARWRPKTG